MRSIENRIYIIYSFALVLFVSVVLFFSYIYHNNYISHKINVITTELTPNTLLLQDAIYTLAREGYDVTYNGEKISSLSNLNIDPDQKIFSIVKYENKNQNELYVLINGVFRASINNGLISEFVNGIYIVIIFSVLLYLVLSFILLGFLIVKITTPLQQISTELKRISNLEFDGKLNITSGLEIKELANNVENIRISLKAYTANRKTLVNALIHELKSPVATISSVMQLHAMGNPKYDLETTRKIIDENVDIINRISLISIDIFEKKSIYLLDSYSVNKIIDDEISNFSPLLDDHFIEINIIEEDVNWVFDKETFSLAIRNIMSNICKYTMHYSTVKIVVTKNYILFSNEISDKITSGTGMGLKLTQSMLRDMGLDLNYYSKDDLFTIKISNKE